MTEQVKTWLLRAVARDIGHDTEDESDWAASDMVFAAADELDALRTATAWRPISTAPQDGTHVLVWDGTYAIGAWFSRGWGEAAGWYVPDPAASDERMWLHGDRGCDLNPTYWQPLPIPPDPAA